LPTESHTGRRPAEERRKSRPRLPPAVSITRHTTRNAHRAELTGPPGAPQARARGRLRRACVPLSVPEVVTRWSPGGSSSSVCSCSTSWPTPGSPPQFCGTSLKAASPLPGRANASAVRGPRFQVSVWSRNHSCRHTRSTMSRSNADQECRQGGADADQAASDRSWLIIDSPTPRKRQCLIT
jgi:hypothetical protein